MIRSLGTTILFVLLVAVEMTMAQSTTQPTSRPMTVYIGTYTNGQSKGVYRATFDAATGTLRDATLSAELKNPTFLAISGDRQFLYAVSEVGEYQNQKTGGVTAFRIAGDGSLTEINHAPTGGRGPCHVSITRDQKTLLIANYGEGTVSSFAVAEDGSIAGPVTTLQHEGSGPNTQRQEKAHAHSFDVDPTGRFALSCDLGTDEIRLYEIGEDSSLTPATHPDFKMPAGSGPRHLVFNRVGNRAYVINELANTVSVLAWDSAHATLTLLESDSTLPDDFDGETKTAEIAVHPNGRFLYGSNRGHDSIAVYAIDPKDGTLESSGFAKTAGPEPRHFAISPTGRWMLIGNQKTDSISVYAIDPDSGQPTPTAETLTVGAPVCIVFLH